MKNKLGQEPAFPFFEYNKSGYGNTIVLEVDGQSQYLPFQAGMSKRLYVATMAMQGILSNGSMIDNDSDVSINWMARVALRFADELLKQESDDTE